MWDLFVQEDLGKSIQKAMLDANYTTPLGEIASRVYNSISDRIHSYFEEGMRKVQVNCTTATLFFCKIVYYDTSL
jgi:hypothetical protein